MNLTVLLVALSAPLSLSAALWPLCRYLTARDASDAAERQISLQRIQAPEVAVATHATGELIPSHLPFDDDEAWQSYQDELKVSNG